MTQTGAYPMAHTIAYPMAHTGAYPRTPQDMDGRLKGVFSKLETSRNMKK